MSALSEPNRGALADADAGVRRAATARDALTIALHDGDADVRADARRALAAAS